MQVCDKELKNPTNMFAYKFFVRKHVTITSNLFSFMQDYFGKNHQNL